MKRLFFLALLLFTFGIVAWPTEPSRITIPQAKELVLASLTAQQRQLPKLTVDPYNESGASRFWFYTVTWEGLPKGSVVVGNYAVDPFTGDVFSAVASCDELHTKKLQALQEEIRAALHLSKAEYQRLKTKGPLCEE
jgi:hypothetical protein